MNFVKDKFRKKLGIMNRRLKQIISITLAIILAIPTVSFAAQENDTYTLYADEAQYENLNSTLAEAGTYDGNHGRVHLQPLRQSQIIFTVNVAEAGEYQLDIVYACNSADRKLGYSVNGGNPVYSGFLTSAGGWSRNKSVTYTVNLNAGDNIIKVVSPTDYNKTVSGKKVGTPGIYAVKVSNAEKNVSITKYADVDAEYAGLNSTAVNGTAYESHGYITLAPQASLAPQGKIIFTADVAKAGDYTLDIVYSNGNATNRKLGYSVNGGAPSYTGFLESSSGWTNTKNVTTTVTLQKGTNTIEVLSPSDYGQSVEGQTVGTPDIFAVKLAIVPPPAVTEGTLYADEAEYEGLADSVAVSGTYEGNHGRVHLQPASGQVGKIIFTANVAEAGYYTLDIVYSNGVAVNRKLGYSVNGGTPSYTGFLESSNGWTNTKNVTTKVRLEAGINTITVLSPSDCGQVVDGQTVGTPDIFAVKFAPYTPPAVTEGTLYADEAEYEGLADSVAVSGTYEGNHGRVHLQPASGQVGKIIFTANVVEAGEYTLGIVYSAKGVTRKLGYSLNEGAATYSGALEATDTWGADKTKTYEVNVTLNEGMNTITLLSPADYDGTTVGTPDIWAVKFAPYVPETPPTPPTPPTLPAVTEGTLYADEAEYEGLKDSVAVSGTYDETHGRVHLQPASGQVGKITFTANVAEAGEYTLGIVYSARGTTRKLGYSVNEGTVAYSDALEATDTWGADKAKTYEVNVTLKEGLNTITVCSPADYDGTIISTPDIWAVKFAPYTSPTPPAPLPVTTKGTLYADEAEYEGLSSTEVKTETFYDETHGRVSLAPKKNGNSYETGKMIFTANIKEAGSYDLYFVYSASAPTRKLGYAVNEGDAKYVTLDYTSTWQSKHAKEYKVTVDLKQGINTITLYSPVDFEPKVVQAPDVWAVKYEPTPVVEPKPVPPVTTEGTLYADEAEYEGLNSTEVKTETFYDKTHGRVSLAPKKNGNGYETGKMIFTVNIGKAGTYDLRFVYSASAPTRKLGYSLNDSEVKYVMLDNSATWKAEHAKEYKVRVDLKEGINTITLYSPADFEPKVVQAPDIWAVKYAPYQKVVVQTERDIIAGTSSKSTSEEAIRLYAGEAETKNLYFDGEVTTNGLLDGAYGYVSPRPETEANDGQIIFTIDVEKEGTYNLDILYAAKKGSTRRIGYSLNGSEILYATIGEYGESFSVAHIKYLNIQVPLKEGENTFTIWSPYDFKSGGILAPNIYAIDYSFAQEKLIDFSEGLKEVLPEGYFAVYADQATYNNLSDEDADYSSKYEGHGRVHLAPSKNADGIYQQGSIVFKVDAEMSGKYEIDIIYSGRGVTRKVEYSVNNGSKVNVELPASSAWDAARAKAYTFEVELKRGENTIILYSPSDYKAGVVQTPDIWAIKGAVKK